MADLAFTPGMLAVAVRRGDGERTTVRVVAVGTRPRQVVVDWYGTQRAFTLTGARNVVAWQHRAPGALYTLEPAPAPTTPAPPED